VPARGSQKNQEQGLAVEEQGLAVEEQGLAVEEQELAGQDLQVLLVRGCYLPVSRHQGSRAGYWCLKHCFHQKKSG
jgi:hypothetical protein